MTALLASDLDRTLIYSRHFFVDPPPLPQCVEFYRGEPISYMTPLAADLLRQLSIHNLLVPTTTRTIAQYNRIDLPGAPYRYAITSNGGTLLIDGTPDVSWTADVAARISAGGPPLCEVQTELQSRIHESWVHSLRNAENLFCYIVVDQAAMPSSFLPSWAQWCFDRGWTVSQQGRKIYTVPEQLCKSRAIAELHHRLTATGVLPEGAPILAAGDGALDAQLLQFAHAAIRPAHGELHDLDWQRPHVSVAARMGAQAAEDILTWFASRTATDSPNQQHPVN